MLYKNWFIFLSCCLPFHLFAQLKWQNVDSLFLNGTCYGEEWALIVNTNGLYGFTGGEPVKISQEVQNLFDLIPTAYAQTMWITNDLGRKEVYIGVPLPTPNQWLPDAPSNPNPTQPTVILMLNYRELNTISALISQAAIRQSLM